MTQYREGQKVRIEMEGVLVKMKTPVGWLHIPQICVVADESGAEMGWLADCKVTILEEPRPDEPEGLGAVVEASSTAYRNKRREYVKCPDSLTGSLRWVSDKGFTDWDELIDPAVFSEGLVK